MSRKIEIKEKEFQYHSFLAGGNSIPKMGYWLFVDDIFVFRKDDKETVEYLAKQLEAHPDFICSYAGVFEDPYEIVDMIVNRDMQFQDGHLIAEKTLDDKIRYIFNGNVSGVSCAFRFTIFDKAYAEKLAEHIKSCKINKFIEINFEPREEED